MTSESDPSETLVPVSPSPLVPRSDPVALPGIVRRVGQAAVFAAEEFFYGAIFAILAYTSARAGGQILQLNQPKPKDRE